MNVFPNDDDDDEDDAGDADDDGSIHEPFPTNAISPSTSLFLNGINQREVLGEMALVGKGS